MKSNRPIKLAVQLSCGLLAIAAAGLARAQAATPAQAVLTNPFVLGLGGFLVGTDVRARLNGTAATNPDVDFDRSFGKADDATRLRADALWRITPAHHLRLMYFDNTSTRRRVLDQEIRWGDYTFAVGAEVVSQAEMKVTELAYEYAFMRGPGHEVAASLGVHQLDTSLQLAGAASVVDANGNVTQVPFATRQSSLPAPLPVIGVRGAWVVSPNWVVDAHAQFFKAKVGDYDGHLTDLRVGATWMFNRNFGLGVGYNHFATKLGTSKASFAGPLRLGYSGLQLAATGTF